MNRRSSKTIPKGFVVRALLCGQRLLLDPQEDTYQSQISESGTYEPGTLNLMSEVLRPGDTFVDVGANLGLMTVHGSSLVGSKGKVFAFEPSPTVYKRLTQNLELNSCKNVQAYQVALGERAQTAIIYKRDSRPPGA